MSAGEKAAAREEGEEQTVRTKCWCRCFQLNWNVGLMLLYTFFWWMAASIFMRDLLSVLVRKISGSDKAVGLISGSQGLMQVLLAFPVAFCGDSFKRQTLLRLAFCVGCGTLGLTVYVYVTLKTGSSLLLFYVCFSLWGAYVVLSNPALESLFADSVPTGKRVRIFSVKHAILQIANATGPAISIGIFYATNNDWKLPTLRRVLLVGTGMGGFAMSLLLLFRDSMSLGVRSEVVAPPDFDSTEEAGVHENYTPLDDVTIHDEYSSDVKMGDDTSCRMPFYSCFHRLNKKAVTRWCIAISDVFTSTAAGMTVKFFPLWFVSDEKSGPLRGYSFLPIQLSWVYLVTPVCTAMLALLLNNLTSYSCVGKVAPLVGSKFLGIAALYAMVFFDTDCKKPLLMASIFVFRTAIMNAAVGIKRSLLMDVTPKKDRSKWNSLESVTRFTWSGSAALGGVVISWIGYRGCFLVTAIVYTLSTTPLFLLFATTAQKSKENREKR